MGLFDRFRKGDEPHVRVHMLVSVGEHVAGVQYDLPVSTADRWLARGYCEGNFSRHYSEFELTELRGNNQLVSVSDGAVVAV